MTENTYCRKTFYTQKRAYAPFKCFRSETFVSTANRSQYFDLAICIMLFFLSSAALSLLYSLHIEWQLIFRFSQPLQHTIPDIVFLLNFIFMRNMTKMQKNIAQFFRCGKIKMIIVKNHNSFSLCFASRKLNYMCSNQSIYTVKKMWGKCGANVGQNLRQKT